MKKRSKSRYGEAGDDESTKAGLREPEVSSRLCSRVECLLDSDSAGGVGACATYRSKKAPSAALEVTSPRRCQEDVTIWPEKHARARFLKCVLVHRTRSEIKPRAALLWDH